MSELTNHHLQELLAQSLLLTRDGVGVFDKEDKLIFCNDAMGGLFGVSAKEALNQTFTSLCLRCFNNPIGINIESSSFDDWISNAHFKRKSCQFRTFETDTQDGRWFLVTEQVVQEDYLYVQSGETKPRSATFLAQGNNNDVYNLAVQSGDPFIITDHPRLGTLQVNITRNSQITNTNLFVYLSKDAFASATALLYSVTWLSPSITSKRTR